MGLLIAHRAGAIAPEKAPLGFAALGPVSFAGTRSLIAAVSDRGENTAPWNAFGSAFGSTGKQDDVAGAQPGFDFGQGGAAMGLDYYFGEGVSGGFSVGVLKGSADVNGNAGSFDITSVRYGFHGAIRRGDFHVSGYAGGASDNYKTKRNTSTASPHGQEMNGAMKLGYDLKQRPVDISFIAGLDLNLTAIDEFSENGAGSSDLKVENQDVRSLRSDVGVTVSKPLPEKTVVLTPYASVAWLHEYQDQGREITAHHPATSAFQSHVADVERDGALAGLGLKIGWKSGVSAIVGYTGEFRSDYAGNGVNADVRMAF